MQNPKELQDLQKDIASLKKYLFTLEERELEAMIKAEDAENDLQNCKNKTGINPGAAWKTNTKN